MTTRDRMLDAAAHVMHTLGLARATTKEIAREAGYSEAALYKHFRDKTDLFLAVLTERTPNTFAPLLGELAGQAGKGELTRNLREVARAAIGFYQHTFPMAASLFSEPDLLAAHRAKLHERNAGPQYISQGLAEYLAAEQKSGAIRPEADPQAAADLLIGACLQHAFLSHFTKSDDSEKDPAIALVNTLLVGLVN